MSTAVQLHNDSSAAAVAAPRTSLGLIRPIAAPAEVLKVQEETRAMLAEILQEGRDYCTIPGTDKASMLKPGAERTALSFGCMYGDPEIVEREVDHDRFVDWTKRKKVWRDEYPGDRRFDWQEESGTSRGLYRYVVRVPVVHRESGQVVGHGIGSCSTMESKYVDRPRDSENTALKMAHKRALISACLIAFGLSDHFTQDTEDMPAEQLVGENAPKLEKLDPPCPKCAGKMHDNRLSKRNPKAPDFKCRDKKCDGVYWPGQAPGSAPAPAVPAMSDEQRDRIAALLARADLDLADDARKKLEKRLADAISGSKPLTTARAAEIIAGLEKALPAEGGVNGDGTIAAPGTQASAMEPRDGKAASAPADDSVLSLTKRITALLDDKRFEESERAALRGRLQQSTDIASLLELLADAEAALDGLPF